MGNRNFKDGVSPVEKRIKKLEAQIHFLVELIDERQLDKFMAAYEEKQSIQEFQGSKNY